MGIPSIFFNLDITNNLQNENLFSTGLHISHSFFDTIQ